MRAGAVAAALVGVALVLSGCQYLLGPLAGGPVFVPGPGDFGSFDPTEPGFSMPPPEATFTKGSAVVTIDGTATKLDRLAGDGRLFKEIGADVGWTDGNGNYLHLYASGGLTGPGFMSIDRIADGQHLGIDPTACTPKIDRSDATGIAGSATCTGLHWVDMLGNFGWVAPPSSAPAFDAEITFEATP